MVMLFVAECSRESTYSSHDQTAPANVVSYAVLEVVTPPPGEMLPNHGSKSDSILSVSSTLSFCLYAMSVETDACAKVTTLALKTECVGRLWLSASMSHLDKHKHYWQ